MTTHWIRDSTCLQAAALRHRTRPPDALDPGFHGVRTQWIRGFIAFQLAWRTQMVRLMVPVGPESGFRRRPAAGYELAGNAVLAVLL